MKKSKTFISNTNTFKKNIKLKDKNFKINKFKKSIISIKFKTKKENQDFSHKFIYIKKIKNPNPKKFMLNLKKLNNENKCIKKLKRCNSFDYNYKKIKYIDNKEWKSIYDHYFKDIYKIKKFNYIDTRIFNVLKSFEKFTKNKKIERLKLHIIPSNLIKIKILSDLYNKFKDYDKINNTCKWIFNRIKNLNFNKNNNKRIKKLNLTQHIKINNTNLNSKFNTKTNNKITKSVANNNLKFISFDDKTSILNKKCFNFNLNNKKIVQKKSNKTKLSNIIIKNNRSYIKKDLFKTKLKINKKKMIKIKKPLFNEYLKF